MAGAQPQNRFFQRVQQLQQERDSLLCIGLDPDPQRFPDDLRRPPKPSRRLPPGFKRYADGIMRFNKAIIDATHDLVCCYKPQFAHHASEGVEGVLEATIHYAQQKGVPVLLDAKRGDVGSTSGHYAREVFERYKADAVTVNPYLGMDSLQPYLDYTDKGIFILCRTSNPGGADLQRLKLADGCLLYEQVAQLAATQWNQAGNVGLVAGATHPEELRRIRQLCPNTPLLLPGLGAQGADPKAMLQATQGRNIIVSASRAILYASQGKDFAAQARAAAQQTLAQLRAPH